MKRRSTFKLLSWFGLGGLMMSPPVHAKTFLTTSQAMSALGAGGARKGSATLTSEQAKSIQSATGVRVRNKTLQVWKTGSGNWFIVDQVIGKHENIDYAVLLSNTGQVRGIEVMVYRESYGHEIMNPRWKAQFHGKGPGTKLKLDREIKNITGATLSCRHITEGINRLTETWNQVLRYL